MENIWLKILFVFSAGGVGAVARYGIESWMRNSILGLSTWVVNSIGCFLIGVFAGWLVNYHCDWNESQRTAFALLTMTGFCGGFSTFSSFTLDCIKYIDKGHFEIWLIFAVMTIFTGLFGCAIGYWLGKQI